MSSIISHKIKNAREAQGLSQRGLALKAGLSGGYIAMIEANKINPSIKALKKIATALNVDPVYFIEEKNNPGALFDQYFAHLTAEEKEFLTKEDTRPWLTLMQELDKADLDPEEVREHLQLFIKLTSQHKKENP